MNRNNGGRGASTLWENEDWDDTPQVSKPVTKPVPSNSSWGGSQNGDESRQTRFGGGGSEREQKNDFGDTTRKEFGSRNNTGVFSGGNQFGANRARTNAEPNADSGNNHVANGNQFNGSGNRYGNRDNNDQAGARPRFGNRDNNDQAGARSGFRNRHNNDQGGGNSFGARGGTGFWNSSRFWNSNRFAPKNDYTDNAGAGYNSRFGGGRFGNNQDANNDGGNQRSGFGGVTSNFAVSTPAARSFTRLESNMNFGKAFYGGRKGLKEWNKESNRRFQTILISILPLVEGLRCLNCRNALDKSEVSCSEHCDGDFCALWTFREMSTDYKSQGCISGIDVETLPMGCRNNNAQATLCLCDSGDLCNDEATQIGPDASQQVIPMPMDTRCHSFTDAPFMKVGSRPSVRSRTCLSDYCFFTQTNTTTALGQSEVITSGSCGPTPQLNFDLLITGSLLWPGSGLLVDACYELQVQKESRILGCACSQDDCNIKSAYPIRRYQKSSCHLGLVGTHSCVGEFCLVQRSFVSGYGLQYLQGCISASDNSLLKPGYRNILGVEQWLCSTDFCNTLDNIGEEVPMVETLQPILNRSQTPLRSAYAHAAAMHNLSTVPAINNGMQSMGKPELRPATPIGARLPENTMDFNTTTSSTLSSSSIATAPVTSTIPSVNALLVSGSTVGNGRPNTPSPMPIRQPLSARLPPLNFAQNGTNTQTQSEKGDDTNGKEQIKLDATSLSLQTSMLPVGQQQYSAPQSLNNTSVVNEIHAIAYDRNRRRPSSAQLPLSRQQLASLNARQNLPGVNGSGIALGVHKPLPAIAEPSKQRSNGSRHGGEHRSRPSPWRFVLKCLLISLFLSIPVVIFILMMALSGGFSTVENPSVLEPASMATTTMLPGSEVADAAGALPPVGGPASVPSAPSPHMVPAPPMAPPPPMAPDTTSV
ncbi:hypothetical protein Ddc_02889 [Ditylenchus destructor]|nr:hypothetical protein Ddc_02889 [Ditylenchus destructor]